MCMAAGRGGAPLASLRRVSRAGAEGSVSTVAPGALHLVQTASADGYGYSHLVHTASPSTSPSLRVPSIFLPTPSTHNTLQISTRSFILVTIRYLTNFTLIFSIRHKIFGYLWKAICNNMATLIYHQNRYLSFRS